jgi:hypothetical protein
VLAFLFSQTAYAVGLGLPHPGFLKRIKESDKGGLTMKHLAGLFMGLQEHSFLHSVPRQYFRPLTVAVVVSALLLVGHTAWADDQQGSGGRGHKGKREPAVRLLGTVPVPVSVTNTTAGMYSFDISFVDQSTQTYYLADRSNQAVDVVEAETFVTQIVPDSGHAPFAGFVPCSPPAGANDCAGPNGVVAAFPWLFVTDAPSRVVTIDLRTGHTVSEVSTKDNEPTRADELAYDPRDGLLLVINNASDPPFGTLISVNKTTGELTRGTNIIFDAAHGVNATNGAEQPVWDPGTGKFYLSIPEISGNKTNLHGAVLRIATTGEVEATYPVDFCGPAGLALGPNEDLLVGCNTVFDTAGNNWTGNADRDTNTAAPQYVILDATTGKIDTNVLGVGAGDEVWFNAGDGHYYTASSGSPLAPNAITPARPPVGTATTAPVLTAQGAAILGVIDAFSKTLDQLVPTLNVPAVVAPAVNPHPAGTAHSVAANAENNHVFVPLAANNVFPACLKGCIAVYGRSDNDKD